MINNSYGSADLDTWSQYKKHPTPANRSTLMQRFDGLIQNHVNKWSGVVPRDVLVNEAKMLAAKAFDTYSPNKGTALATHVTNNLLPLSRVVYTYQNTTRLPENITIKMHEFNAAKTHLTAVYGREPTTDELHQELGWTTGDINRIQSYDRKNLVESGNAVSGDFYNTKDINDDEDDMIMGAVYMELTPQEKQLFEATTGWGGAKILSNPQIMKKLKISQAQLSYQKTLLTKKIDDIMSRPSLRRRYGTS